MAIVTPYEGLFACGLLRRVYLCDLLGREDLGFDARLARLIILEATQAPDEARVPERILGAESLDELFGDLH